MLQGQCIVTGIDRKGKVCFKETLDNPFDVAAFNTERWLLRARAEGAVRVVCDFAVEPHPRFK